MLFGIPLTNLFNTIWASTLAATTPTTRREEGGFVMLDTASGLYWLWPYPTRLGPVVGNHMLAEIDLRTFPDDNPQYPSAVDAVRYVVASFHTHTPAKNITYANSRRIGPSRDDNIIAIADKIPGFVFDYVEDENLPGRIPAGHPINAEAKIYQTTPPSIDRRPTP
jgi:hypothetical protein